MSESRWPGFGAGLRREHYAQILSGAKHSIDWFEAISENYMDSEGRPTVVLTRVRENFEIALHGVSMSIGSIRGPGENYLNRLRNLADRVQPFLISDHVCWSSHDSHLHDLLPLPFTEEALQLLTENISRVQDTLGRSIALENVSTYLSFKHSTLNEWDFLNELSRRSGCKILLDINNIFVNARNHGFDGAHFINAIDVDSVVQFHLAGHTDKKDFLFDTHSTPVSEEVWNLYDLAAGRFKKAAVILEWDEDIPDLQTLENEIGKARNRVQAAPSDDAVPHARAVHAGPSLTILQREFSRRMLGADHELDETMIHGAGTLSIADALDVYRKGYVARLGEALGEIYEATWRILGDDRFFKSGVEFISLARSMSPNLSHYGEGFPPFLKSQFPELPFIQDLAQFEWNFARLFHMSVENNFAPITETGRIRLARSSFLFQSDFPIHSMWSAKNDAEVSGLEIKPECGIVYKEAVTEIAYRLLSPQQFEILKNLEGRSIAEALESTDADPESVHDLFEFLGRNQLLRSIHE